MNTPSTNPTLNDAILYTLCARPSWCNGPGRATAACNSRHLVSHLGGDTRLGDIKPAHVAELRASLASDGHSPGTVNRILSALSTILRTCYQDGLLETAPIPIRREKESEGRLTWFTKAQVDFMDQKCTNPALGALIKFAAYTGLRRGELFRLRAKDVSVGSGWTTITVGGDAATCTKNGTVRTIPLCSQAFEALSQHVSIQTVYDGPDSDVLIWGELFPNVDVAMRQFTATRKRCGLPDDLVFHSLRHSFGTWHAEAGTPIRTLMALMGHKDIKTTLRYAKATDESLKAAMEAFSR